MSTSPSTGAKPLTAGSNGITPLRLVLALLVVFSHAYPIGGFGPDPLKSVTAQTELGQMAVIGFFGLSGYLLAASRLSSSLSRYVRRRALRILPGLLVSLAVVAVVIIPLAVSRGGTASSTDVLNWVRSNATFQPFPVEIAGLYPGSAVPWIVNAPLWTLPWEVYLYAAIGIVGLGGVRLMRTVIPGLLLLAFAISTYTLHTAVELYGQLPVAFLAGSAIYVHRVPIRRDLAVGAIAITVVAAVSGILQLIGPITLAYLALYVGLRWPLRWTLDLSYGVYIYGWPIQSILAVLGVTSLGLVAYLAASILPILGVAYLSARFVESPFMATRLSLPRRHLVTTAPTEP